MMFSDVHKIGEVEALLPVIGMLLQFSPEEVKFPIPTWFSGN